MTMPEGECRFDEYGYCQIHDRMAVKEPWPNVPPGAGLCMVATVALQAKVARLEGQVAEAASTEVYCGAVCGTCGFTYREHKGHIRRCPLCLAKNLEARMAASEDRSFQLAQDKMHVESLLATRAAQVGAMREALEKRDCPEHPGNAYGGKCEGCREAEKRIDAALSSGGRDKEKP